MQLAWYEIQLKNIGLAFKEREGIEALKEVKSSGLI